MSNSSALTNAFITLLGMNGAQLQTIGTIGAGGTFFDTFELPSAGTYTLLVDVAGNATGCATFQLFAVPPDVVVAITAGGAPMQACNTAPGQDIDLAFSATGGDRISMHVTNSTLTGAFVTLHRPNRTLLANVGTIGAGTTFFDTQELPVSGTYTLHVEVVGSTMGCATFELHAVPPDPTAALTVGGAAVQVCTTVPGQDVALTFSGTASQSVSLRVASGNTLGGSFVTLRRPNGTLLQNVGTIIAQGQTFAAVTLPDTGSFMFHVDVSGDDVGCATFSLV